MPMWTRTRRSRTGLSDQGAFSVSNALGSHLTAWCSARRLTSRFQRREPITLRCARCSHSAAFQTVRYLVFRLPRRQPLKLRRSADAEGSTTIRIAHSRGLVRLARVNAGLLKDASVSPRPASWGGGDFGDAY